MSEEDDSQKTEDPTQKRIDDAREKGQIPVSKEINSFMILGVFTMIALGFMPAIMRDVRFALMPYLESPEEFSLEDGGFALQILNTIGEMAVIMAFPVILAIAAALGAGFMQSRFNLSTDPLIPKLERISPLKGLQRMFAVRSVVELIKGIVKISLVAAVAAISLWSSIEAIRLLPGYDLMEMLHFTDGMVSKMLIGMLCMVFFIAILDYLYQRYEYYKSLRMTKQELKDEYKQQEGDPAVKQRLRSIRMERARKRMMAAVPSADVVITNPTHFAVALKYDADTMSAPVLIAKGHDEVAARIRKVAEENKIIIMRNPPLARALYDNVDIDDPIPTAYFKAVAEIIAYVFKLKGKKMPGGGTDAKQAPTAVPKTLNMPEKKKKK